MNLKRKLAVLYLLLIIVMVSCTEREGLPVAVIYTRESEISEEAGDIENVEEIENIIEEPEITDEITETTEITPEESIPLPVSELPAVMEMEPYESPDVITVVVNLSTMTFHTDYDCRHIDSMKDENRYEESGTIEEIKAMGYTPCGTCSAQYKD